MANQNRRGDMSNNRARLSGSGLLATVAVAGALSMLSFMSVHVSGEGGLQAPLPPTNVRLVDTTVGTATGPLGPSAFTYVGAMRLDPAGVDLSYSYGGFAARRVGGVLHFFITGNNVAHDPVYEFVDTGDYRQDYTQAPRAALATAWGDIYQGRRVSWDSSGTQFALQYLITPTLFWDEAQQRLFWTYFDAYNVTGRNDWSLGSTALNGSPGAMVAHGPWRLSTRVNHSFGWIVPAPDGTYGVGAPLSSGNAGSSWGPELTTGLRLPSDSTPAGFGAPDLPVPTTRVRYYQAAPDLNADGSIAAGHTVKALPRTPANYIYHQPPSGTQPVEINPTLNGGNGSWVDSDSLSGAVWINLADKQGVLFVGTRGTSNVWYGATTGNAWGDAECGGGQGPNASYYETRFFVYNPADLAAVAAGTTPSYAIRPMSEFDPRAAIYPFKVTCGGGVTKSFGGAYFDAGTRLLYVVSRSADDSIGGLYLPLIHVFRIN